jgi:chemotaxis family two-component system sensor histidine kinase/response regulator PixL
MSDWWQNCEKEVLNWLGIQTLQSTPEQQTMVGIPDVDREQIYTDFLHEAQELLQVIEQELLSLREEYSIAKVHNLMRAAHTLKGSSASMGLHNLSQIAHGLEDVVKSLYNPEVEIDAELESLFLGAYEYLQLAVAEASLRGSQSDPQALDRAAQALAKVQQKLGDDYNPDAEIPSSVELGFDIVGSIFEVGVQQRIEEIERAIESQNPYEIEETLSGAITIFLGLAESLNLPGFGEIAQVAKTAIVTHPDRILEIAPIALNNFVEGQKQVLEGDREVGGQPSEALQDWVAANSTPTADSLGTESLFDASTTIDIEADEAWDFSEDAIAASPELNNFADREEPSLDSIFGNLNPTELSQFNQLEEPQSPEPEPEPEAIPDFEMVPLEPEADFDIAAFDSEPEPELDLLAQTPQASVGNIPATVRVELERLKRLNFQAGELSINQNNQMVQNQQLLGALRDLRSRMQQHARTLNRLANWQLGQGDPIVLTSATGNNGHALTLMDLDSLELEQYSELRLLLQKTKEEMVQMEETAEVFDLFARSGRQALEKQQRLLKTVRDDLTLARMQEFGNILGRLERLVQQLRITSKKSVDLRIAGKNVLIDKAISQTLYDPLLHIVRNAFAHGIETPEERAYNGKSEVGHITIRAYNQGNRTFIEVKDDGRGLDYDRIRDRAVENHHITAAEAQRLGPEELQRFIFIPGFSTTQDVDDLRGRGVGLDVVQSHLDAIGATLTVNSQTTQGTTFTIRLPLTLSIAKLIVCQVGELAYAVPTDSIEQILLLRPDRVKQIGPQRALQWQKSRTNGKEKQEYTVPLYHLQDLLEYTSPLASRNRQTAIANSMVMLLKLKDSLVGIEVDRVLGEQELTLRPLGQTIAPPAYIDGCSVLGDNRLALALDLVVLIENYLSPDRPSPILSLPPSLDTNNPILWSNAETPARSSILIIDDSITLRRNLTNTLKKAGYPILEANDGINAIAQLEQYHPQINLIVSDLEMPQMNGFELLNYCQQHPQYQKIPILVLTSRQSDKHRQIALNLGASGYITKPYLEHDLLSKISDFLPLSAQIAK